MGDNNDALRFEIRSFVPYKKFAGGFHGDDRGFSIAGNGTSRISASVDLLPVNASFRNLSVNTDATYGPLEGIGPLGGDYSRPSALLKVIEQTDLGATYRVQIAGSNPIVLPSPDIDVKVDLSIERITLTTIHVHAKFSGDQFPAMEAILRDSSGQGVFLGGFMPPSAWGVLTNLPGNADRAMGSVEMTITLSEKGSFERVKNWELTGLNGTVGNKLDLGSSFTVNAWNRVAQSIATPDGMPHPERIKQPVVERSNLKPAGEEHHNQAESKWHERTHDGMGR